VPLDENFNVTDATRICKTYNWCDTETRWKRNFDVTFRQTKGSWRTIFIKTHPEYNCWCLGVPVQFASNCIGAEAKEAADKLQPRSVLNLRFSEEEVEMWLSQRISHLRYLCKWCFGTHRAHAQQLLLHNFSNSKMFGLLLAKEIESLNKVLKTVKTSNLFWWL
jgi:phosphoglycerate kinase